MSESICCGLQNFSGRVEGVKVETIDTTGAGDAFVAGTLNQLAKDLSIINVRILFSRKRNKLELIDALFF